MLSTRIVDFSLKRESSRNRPQFEMMNGESQDRHKTNPDNLILLERERALPVDGFRVCMRPRKTE